MSDIKNVLLIEDNENDLDIMKHYITKAFPSFVFVVANCKAEFEEKFDWLSPDLVLSDFDLPDGNGLEILLSVKKRIDVPFIFVSGTLNDTSKLGDAILEGANGYVLKENISTLPACINRVLGKYDAIKVNKQIKENALSSLRLNNQKAIKLLEDKSDHHKIKEILTKSESYLNDL